MVEQMGSPVDSADTRSIVTGECIEMSSLMEFDVLDVSTCLCYVLERRVAISCPGFLFRLYTTDQGRGMPLMSILASLAKDRIRLDLKSRRTYTCEALRQKNEVSGAKYKWGLVGPHILRL